MAPTIALPFETFAGGFGDAGAVAHSALVPVGGGSLKSDMIVAYSEPAASPGQPDGVCGHTAARNERSDVWKAPSRGRARRGAAGGSVGPASRSCCGCDRGAPWR